MSVLIILCGYSAVKVLALFVLAKLVSIYPSSLCLIFYSFFRYNLRMYRFMVQNPYLYSCILILITSLCVYVYLYNTVFVLDTSAVVAQLGGASQEISHSPSFIVSSIAGAVAHPGAYKLPLDARVGELLQRAGGVSAEFSPLWFARRVNLAEKLTDGSFIYIPYRWEVNLSSSVGTFDLPEQLSDDFIPLRDVASSSVGSSHATSISRESDTDAPMSLININTASKEDLMSLPRVGEVTAQRIIDARPYGGLEDLSVRADLYKSVIDAIKDLITY